MTGVELLKEWGDDITSPTPLRTLIETVADQRSFKTGDVIFREGDVAETTYAVAQGEVDIVKADSAVIATRSPGEEFGEMAFVDGGRRSATARARRDSLLTRVGYDSLRTVLRKNPQAAALFYRNGAAFLTECLRQTSLDLQFDRDRNRSHL